MLEARDGRRHLLRRRPAGRSTSSSRPTPRSTSWSPGPRRPPACCRALDRGRAPDPEPYYGYHVGAARVVGVAGLCRPQPRVESPRRRCGRRSPRAREARALHPLEPLAASRAGARRRRAGGRGARPDRRHGRDLRVITYDGRGGLTGPASAAMAARTATILGLRRPASRLALGYVAPAPRPSSSSSCTCSTSVRRPAPARRRGGVRLPEGFFEEMQRTTRKRSARGDAPGGRVTPIVPEGAYYVLADVLAGLQTAEAARRVDEAGWRRSPGRRSSRHRRGDRIVRFCYAKERRGGGLPAAAHLGRLQVRISAMSEPTAQDWAARAARAARSGPCPRDPGRPRDRRTRPGASRSGPAGAARPDLLPPGGGPLPTRRAAAAAPARTPRCPLRGSGRHLGRGGRAPRLRPAAPEAPSERGAQVFWLSPGHPDDRGFGRRDVPQGLFRSDDGGRSGARGGCTGTCVEEWTDLEGDRPRRSWVHSVHVDPRPARGWCSPCRAAASSRPRRRRAERLAVARSRRRGDTTARDARDHQPRSPLDAGAPRRPPDREDSLGSHRPRRPAPPGRRLRIAAHPHDPDMLGGPPRRGRSGARPPAAGRPAAVPNPGRGGDVGAAGAGLAGDRSVWTVAALLVDGRDPPTSTGHVDREARSSATRGVVDGLATGPRRSTASRSMSAARRDPRRGAHRRASAGAASRA